MYLCISNAHFGSASWSQGNAPVPRRQAHGQAEVQAAARTLDAAAAKAAGEALAKVAASKDGAAALGRAPAAAAPAPADAARGAPAGAAPAPAAPAPASHAAGPAAQGAARAPPPAPAPAAAAPGGAEPLLAVSARKEERARRCGASPGEGWQPVGASCMWPKRRTCMSAGASAVSCRRPRRVRPQNASPPGASGRARARAQGPLPLQQV